MPNDIEDGLWFTLIRKKGDSSAAGYELILTDIEDSTSRCYVLSHVPSFSLKIQILAEKAIKLYEMISFLVKNFVNKDLVERQRSCPVLTDSTLNNDPFLSFICKQKQKSGYTGECSRPLLSEKALQFFTKARCEASYPVLGELYNLDLKLGKARQSSALHREADGEIGKRSILSLFGNSGTSAEVISALNVDKSNVEKLYQNEITLFDMIKKVNGDNKVLIDSNNINLAKTGDAINSLTLTRSIDEFLASITEEARGKTDVVDLIRYQMDEMITSLSSIFERAANYFDGATTSCYNLHDQILCPRGNMELRYEFQSDRFLIGSLVDKVAVDRKFTLACVPIKHGLLRFQGQQIVFADTKHLMTETGVVVPYNPNPSHFDEDYDSVHQYDPCYYRVILGHPTILMSCSRNTTVLQKGDGRQYTVGAYEMYSIDQSKFPLRQSSHSVNLNDLISKQKRKRMSFESMYKKEKPVPVTPELFHQRLDRYFESELNNQINETSLLSLITRNRDFKTYFSISLAFGGLVVTGLSVYCFLKIRKWYLKREENEKNIQEAGIELAPLKNSNYGPKGDVAFNNQSRPGRNRFK